MNQQPKIIQIMMMSSTNYSSAGTRLLGLTDTGEVYEWDGVSKRWELKIPTLEVQQSGENNAEI